MGRPMRWMARLGGALLLLAALPLDDSPLGADPASPGASLETQQAELRALRDQITRKRQEVERLRREGKDVETLLGELERERVIGERYVRTLQSQEAELTADIEQRRARVDAQEAQITRTRSGLAAALVRYHKEGRVSAAELLVTSSTFSEVFARAHYWGRTVRRLRDRVFQLADQQHLLQEELSEVERRRGRVSALRREREAEIRTLEEREAERRAHRRALERTIADYEEQTRKLLASQARIEELIAAAQRAGGAGAGLAHLKGQLPWPVRGRVVKAFGTHVHPKYGTRVRHKGITIAADEGAPIRAVAPGRVVFVGWLEGYGRTVILDHGQGFFSLYAHASETLVAHEGMVAAGDAVARVGSTDSLAGSSLHFEIRRGPEALDPSGWLDRRGGR